MRQLALPDVRPEHGQERVAHKLALLEALLTSDSIESVAQRCVDWLGEHTRARRILCAAETKDADQIAGLAGYGIEARQIRTFAVDTTTIAHPLYAALLSIDPFRTFDNGSENASLLIPAMGKGTFLAVPLVELGSQRTLARGLLLVSPLDARTISDACWLAHILGEKLARTRVHAANAEEVRRLERERELLYLVINAVPDPILLTDTESRMIIANARAESFLVSVEGESEGRSRAVALNNMFFSAALSRRAIEGSEPDRRELLLVDPEDGSDRVFELLSSLASSPGESSCVVSVLRNVSDLRAANEELEENYRRLRLAEADARAERDRLDLIIDSVVDPIVVTDPNGGIVHMNAPAERLFTASPELHGEDAVRVVRANDALLSSFLSTVLIGERSARFRGELVLVDPHTAQSMPVEAISGTVVSEQGEASAVVTILHDRTEAIEKAELYEQVKHASSELAQKVREATGELVHQNELLQRQHIELEQASSLKSQFLANMSHEFRTPLNAILGFSGLLLKSIYGPMPPQQLRAVTRVDSNARHLLTIINDILDIAKIEAGRMPLRQERFRVDALVGEVMAQVEPLARPELAMVTRLPQRLPWVKSDRQKVKQIVLNLITNAIKFTPQGSVTVSARYEESEDCVAIAVSDTGIGIAKDDHQKIFEDFRQVDSSPSREYGGTGLGLSICLRLSRMLGGSVALESELGRGSTFTLIIPRRLRRK